MGEGISKGTGQFRMLDLAKLAAAIMVIALHTTPFSDIHSILDKSSIGLCRFGVPFFFFASAYLYFRKADPLKRFKHYVFRISRYWIFFSILSMILIKPDLRHGVIRTFLCDGYGVCWFFHGLIVSIGMVCLLLAIGEKWRVWGYLLYVLSYLLYIAGILLNTYFSMLPESLKEFFEVYYFTPFVTARNGFFGGTIYALMGYYMAKADRWKRSLPFCLVCLFASTVLFCGELMLSWLFTEKIHGREMFLTMPFLVLSVFFLLQELEKRYGNRISPEFCFMGRKISFAMYGWQILYLTVVPGTLHSMVRFFLVTACTTITGIFLVNLSRMPKWKKITSIMI